MVSNGMFSLDTSILHGALVGSGPLLFVTMVISWNWGGMYGVEIENLNSKLQTHLRASLTTAPNNWVLQSDNLHQKLYILVSATSLLLL